VVFPVRAVCNVSLGRRFHVSNERVQTLTKLSPDNYGESCEHIIPQAERSERLFTQTELCDWETYGKRNDDPGQMGTDFFHLLNRERRPPRSGLYREDSSV